MFSTLGIKSLRANSGGEHTAPKAMAPGVQLYGVALSLGANGDTTKAGFQALTP